MDLYDGLLSELECEVCVTYMGPPIRQCATGHSICELCMKRLTNCPLCRSEFTTARNIALESLARKIRYPCVNQGSGCYERLLLDDREKHEATCDWTEYKCALRRCTWTGAHKHLEKHWLSKSWQRTYTDHNVCHYKLDKVDKYNFINLCVALGQLFWFKFRNVDGKLYWNVQFIGYEKLAKKYYFEVEIYTPGNQIRKYIMSDYCTTENEPETQTAVTTTLVSLNSYFGKDQILNYFLNIKEVPSKDKDLSKSVDNLLIHIDDTKSPDNRRKDMPKKKY